VSKGEKVMDGGHGLSSESGRLRPVGGMKNIGSTDKKFNGKEVELVPNKFQKS
jgi:hypothetical protein